MQALVFIEANGKARAWSKILRDIGVTATVIATTGHVCSYPRGLFPIGIDLGAKGRFERLRAPIPEKRQRILDAVSAAPRDAAIIVACDNDTEGDVISLDVVDIIRAQFPARMNRVVRVQPGPITPSGVRTALASARNLVECNEDMIDDAVAGRARAATDRWIGATFSRQAGLPVGRVRSAILGTVWMMARNPHLLRQRPETGEITIQARSATGGRPFVARIPLFGGEDPEYLSVLRALAAKWAGRPVPGIVRIPTPAGAAIAPRVGSVRPFTTAEALVYAARFHAIPVQMAMKGLQNGYQAGILSYPRTDSRFISDDSANRITMLGQSMGLQGLEAVVLSSQARVAQIDGPAPAHEALHPVMPITTANANFLKSVVRLPIREPSEGWDQASVNKAMIAIVARRAMEAARDIVEEWGNWQPDNQAPVSNEEADILRDLDFVREVNFNFPWTRSYATGERAWPLDAVLLETMAEEEIGRPSTYAAHIATAIESGDIEAGADFEPPRPSPQGMTTLKRTPKSVWHPATCRMIERALENSGNILREDEDAPIELRARHRVLSWLQRVPADMREALLEALNGEVAGRIPGSGPSLPVADAAGAAEYDLSAVPEPSPFAN